VAIAWEAMQANRIRSLLTILGVAVGVSVVVLIGALMTGLRTEVMDAFNSAGPNNFVVTRIDFTAIVLSGGGDNRPPWWNRPEIQPSEARGIAALPTIRAALYDLNNFQIDINFEGQTMENVLASGTSAGWPDYNPGDFVVGRNFTPAEVQQYRAVVVLSSGLANELFGQRDPVGRRIRVGNPFRGTLEPFNVIGVFELEENIFSAAFQNWAIFPWTSSIRRLRQNKFQAQILVVPEDSVSAARAQDDVITAMRGTRGLGPREENDFALMSSAQILDMFNQLTSVFFLVILLLASAGLLVGGVGVIGIMLISVTERTREIGIRRALGAKKRRIIGRAILPNLIGIITVNLTIAVAGAILLESTLSFLGLGVQVPTPTWGNMLDSAKSFIETEPYLVWFPGLAIVITVLCVNFVGDGLRDALDPTQRKT